MKLRGGYNISVSGKPCDAVKHVAEPDILYFPLQSRRFEFSEICVEDGQRVSAGDVLAKDPNNYGVPLLASRGGTVSLTSAAYHIVLEKLETGFGQLESFDTESLEGKCAKLFAYGAWEYFCEAYSGSLPNPLARPPQAAIVTAVSLEPYTASAESHLEGRLAAFSRGLEHLKTLVDGRMVYLVVGKEKSDFTSRIRHEVEKVGWVKLVEIPMKYPNDNYTVLARALGLKKSEGAVWGIGADGILAIDDVLSSSRPCTERVISVGGSGVNKPVHLKVMTGYPIRAIDESYSSCAGVRIINGGMLTGRFTGENTLGVDSECRGLTILINTREREFFNWVRPGWDRKSYSGCFTSFLRRPFGEAITTQVRGEVRPCICCNYCDEVCPAGIMPHLIHKYLYKDMVEEVEDARVDLCVECGLCSFVCPSKIELTKQFSEAKRSIEEEKEHARLAQERHEQQQKKSQQKSEEKSD